MVVIWVFLSVILVSMWSMFLGSLKFQNSQLGMNEISNAILNSSTILNISTIQNNHHLRKTLFPQLPRHPNSSLVPVGNPFDGVYQRKIKENIHRFGHVTRMLLIGDSILHRMMKNSSIATKWEKEYSPINFASPGFRTENVLFYIEQNLYKNVTSIPILVVMLGSSNAIIGDSSASIVLGISEVVSKFQLLFPNSSIILLSPIPRAPSQLILTLEEVASKLDNLYSSHRDLGNHRVIYRNVCPLFLSENHHLITDRYYVDQVHPSHSGYELLVAEVEHLLLNMTSI